MARKTAAENQDALRRQIKQMILDNHLRPGDPIPTEPALMERLGVSRNPLREAIKALQASGIVEVRHGFGTFVGTTSLHSLQDGLEFRLLNSLQGDPRAVNDLLEVRQALEVGMAAAVLDHFKDADLAELEQIVVQMENDAARDRYPTPETDVRFHLWLYAPLGNELVTDLIQLFWQTFANIEHRLPPRQYRPHDAAGWHRDLFTALASHEPADYTAAMVRHFTGARGQFRSIAAKPAATSDPPTTPIRNSHSRKKNR